MKRSSDVAQRKPDFEIDLTNQAGIIEYTLFYLNRAANVAGMCMTDHLADDGVVHDMHAVIGALGAAMNAVQLLETLDRPQPGTGPTTGPAAGKGEDGR